MLGRGPEDVFLDNENFSEPLHFVTKVFKDKSFQSFLLAVAFLCVKFDDKFLSNISYNNIWYIIMIIISDANPSREKSGP